MRVLSWNRLQRLDERFARASDAGPLEEALRLVHTVKGGLAGPPQGDDGIRRRREVHSVLSRYLLHCIHDPLRQGQAGGLRLPTEVFAIRLIDEWAEESRTLAAALAENVPTNRRMVGSWLAELIEGLPCNSRHPLFDFLEGEASEAGLRYALTAENLCDLNFTAIVGNLLPGMLGAPAVEVGRNVWEELGEGSWRNAHRVERVTMMRTLGVSGRDLTGTVSGSITEELEHFNAYVANGVRRKYSARLVGMLVATETLVPDQQKRVLGGWRRVGVDDEALGYMLGHIEGDVDHGAGWLHRVVTPLLNEHFQVQELICGVHQHAEILSRKYDAILSVARALV